MASLDHRTVAAGALEKLDLTMAFGKWDHSLGHDRLTAEHNAVVDAVDALANVLREIERSVALSTHERDMVQAALMKYRVVTPEDVFIQSS